MLLQEHFYSSSSLALSFFHNFPLVATLAAAIKNAKADDDQRKEQG